MKRNPVKPAIYDPRSNDNEEKSAFWAANILSELGAVESVHVRVRDLIMGTKHDSVPISSDARLISDIDLSILGQPFEIFQSYENRIREEYSWVPAEAYKEARSTVLRSFLSRPRIYFSDRFENKYGFQAKENLSWALSAMG